MATSTRSSTLTPLSDAEAPVPPRKRGLLLRIAGRVVLYSCLAYVAWCTALYFFQDKLIFPRDLIPDPLAAVPASTDQWSQDLDESSRRVAWFVLSAVAKTGQPAPAVIFFHGNGEIVDYQDRITNLYRRLGCSVLLVEYRGYRRSKGQPSQDALVADAVYFYDELARRPEVDPKRIVIQGHSLGGAVAAQLAAQRRPAAIILESTVTSIAGMAWRYGAPSFLVRHPFRTDEILPSFDWPILICHGRGDLIVPVSHGRRLHELSPHAVYLEYDCDHFVPGPRNEKAYAEQIRQFLVTSGVLSSRPS